MSLFEIPITCMGAHPRFGKVVFQIFVTRTQHPWLVGTVSCQVPVDLLVWWRIASPSTPESKSWLHKGTWRRLGNQLGAPSIRLVRTWIQTIGMPLGGRRGAWSPPRDPRVTLSGVKLGLSGLGNGAKVCETPLGIREVEHLLGFLISKIDQDEKQHK
jgi:hypothetical protein